MEILLLGNGFDLAHNLQTSYVDFLDFSQSFFSIYSNPTIMKSGGLNNTAKPLYKYLDKLIFEKEDCAAEFSQMAENNFWIKYFVRRADSIGKRWIDFEAEISKVVRQIDDDERSEVHSYEGEMRFLSDDDAEEVFSEIGLDSSLYQDLFDRMENDLGRLIRAFEIYLSACINQEEIECRVPEISKLHPDKVLTFNYTNTYERLYDSEGRVSVCHIHGLADEENVFKSKKTNMVLGIDEYISDDEEKKENLEHIEFKKYYQRIIKCTGNDYLQWIDNIRDNWEMLDEKKRKEARKLLSLPGAAKVSDIKDIAHSLYVFGHSLGKTDGDILKKLICNDNVQTTIFYYDKESFKSQVKNLVQIIGPDELIKRTGGLSKTIWFKEQLK